MTPERDESGWRTAVREINGELTNFKVDYDNLVELGVMFEALSAALVNGFLNGESDWYELVDVINHLGLDAKLGKHIDSTVQNAVTELTEETSKANYWAAKERMSTEVRYSIMGNLGVLTRAIQKVLKEHAS